MGRTAEAIDWGNLRGSLIGADKVLVDKAVAALRHDVVLVGVPSKVRAAAVICARDYGLTASGIARLARFNGHKARLLADHAGLVPPHLVTCTQCGIRPRRVGRWCTWCWDKNEGNEKADGAGQTPGSAPTPSNS